MSDILMKKDSWELIAYPSPTGLRSYIVHRCPTPTNTSHEFANRFWYVEVVMETPCYDCHAHVPVELTGAWRLHNFDHIQEGEK